MRLLFILLCVYLVGVKGRLFVRGRERGGNYGKPFVADEIKLPPAQWFEQILDHFNPSDKRLWKQKYFVNDTFYDPKRPGPVFLMIGGEGKASAEWMVAGQWIEYAKEFKALCLQLEHRYYGDSHPTSDMSVKNLVYLNSEQALADLANFIVSMNDKYLFDSNVKWIVFGGSYPGSLAAWMRLKYPHLVHGAVSSSGPLLAKIDFMEYYDVVVDALTKTSGSDDCVNAIKLATQQINKLIKHSPQQLESKFRLCSPLVDAGKLDIMNFYETLASNFAGVVQYHNDNRIGESAKLANITIEYVCRLMTDNTAGSEYQRMAEFNSIMLDMSEQKCLDYNYSNMVRDLRNSSWESTTADGGRQWTYQTCTEFGFYQTSSGQPEVFGNNFTVDFFIQQCADIFGNKYDAPYLDYATQRTNMIYGGLDIESNRIVFIHGSVDPWHALGITKTLDNDAPALYVEGPTLAPFHLMLSVNAAHQIFRANHKCPAGLIPTENTQALLQIVMRRLRRHYQVCTAHCANMYPPRDSDLPQLKQARLEIAQFIQGWLNK